MDKDQLDSKLKQAWQNFDRDRTAALAKYNKARATAKTRFDADMKAARAKYEFAIVITTAADIIAKKS